MILSFSVPEMLPLIRDGLQQAKGLNIKTRVKRQTIRKWGPQAERVLAAPSFPYSLSLWWKSRTKEREFLGIFEAAFVTAERLAVTHDAAGIVWVVLASIGVDMRWQQASRANPLGTDNGLTEFAYADGFDSPEAFRDYFVPKPGDVFKGILYRW